MPERKARKCSLQSMILERCGCINTDENTIDKQSAMFSSNIGNDRRTRRQKFIGGEFVVVNPKKVTKTSSQETACAAPNTPRKKAVQKHPKRKAKLNKRPAKKVVNNARKPKGHVRGKTRLKVDATSQCAENLESGDCGASKVKVDGHSPCQSSNANLRRSSRICRNRITESVLVQKAERQKRARKPASLNEGNAQSTKRSSSKVSEDRTERKTVWTAERRKQVGQFLTQQRILAKLKRYGLDPETATSEQIEEKRRERNRLRSRKRNRKRDPEKQRAYRKMYMERMTPEQKQRYLAQKRAAKARLIERRKAELLEELEKKRREYWDSSRADEERDVVEVELQQLMDSFPKTLKEIWNKKKMLTPEELERRRQRERERHRRMRANYTPEQRAKRLEQNRQARMRAKERGYTDEQREARRERNRRSYRRKMEALGRSVKPRSSVKRWSTESVDASERDGSFLSRFAEKPSRSRCSKGREEEEEVRIVLDDEENDDSPADKPSSSRRSCVIRRRKSHPCSEPDPVTTCKFLRSIEPAAGNRSFQSVREGRIVTAVLRPIESGNIWCEEVYDEQQGEFRHVIEVPDGCEVLYMDYVDQAPDELL